MAVMPSLAQQIEATEIAGGRGGDEFSDFQVPPGAKVAMVHVRSGERVDSVQMVYVLPNGRNVAGPRHGGNGGDLTSLRLDPDEYIIGISGRCGDGIDSLRIHTNKRISRPFGGRGGNRDFRINIPPRSQAVGFVGRAGEYLDAIGLTYVPIFTPQRRGGSMRATQISQTNLAGGGGGSAFADGEAPPGGRIAEVRVRSGDRIDSVQVVYRLPDGRSFDGARHGGTGGNERIFQLRPGEYITGLSGRCGDGVDSLRIHTNLRTSELFGGRGGDRDFRLEVPRGAEVLGFTGRAGEYLDAVGLTFVR